MDAETGVAAFSNEGGYGFCKFRRFLILSQFIIQSICGKIVLKIYVTMDLTGENAMSARTSIVKKLRQVYQSREFIIAVAVGCGISARCAVAGGADLLLVLNSGRFRQMGLSSLAGMMPYSNSNEMVLDFASKEIIPQITNIPVIFGLCATDPTIDLVIFIDKVIQNGFTGLNNFPTVGLIDGTFRDVLEEEGFSFQKEVDAIRIAHTKGLFTLAFVFNTEQALKMADAGADVICVHLGFTRGGILGVKRYKTLSEAAVFAREIFEMLDRKNINIIKLVYGGPIQSPSDAKFVFDNSGSMGFIGGSSFERIPNEKMISDITRQFKMIGLEQETAIDRLHSLESNYDYIDSIKKYVTKHYMEEITFQDIADSIHISRNYLSVLFKKELGCTFPQYLFNTRMHKAREILSKNNSIRVKELAMLVGFSDYSYFTRKFKEFFGVTPRCFIK